MIVVAIARRRVEPPMSTATSTAGQSAGAGPAPSRRPGSRKTADRTHRAADFV